MKTVSLPGGPLRVRLDRFRWRPIVNRTSLPVLVVLVLLFLFMSVWQDAFFTKINLENVATSVTVLWVVALGQTFVLLSGGIDLSSGAIAAAAGIFLAKLLGDASLPGALILVLVVAFGTAIGAVANGILIGYMRLNVFVVTLATMISLTGVVSLWSGSNSTYVTSSAVAWISVRQLAGLPTPIWIMIITLLVFALVQSRTYFGRDVYAVGGNIVAARLSGVRPGRTAVIVYGIAGGMAALAGIIAVGRIGAAAPQVDNTLPLNAIAAVLLGGTSLLGGVGGVGGTALGVLLIGVLQNGLSLSGVPTYWQQVLTGLILLFAVVGDRLRVFLEGHGRRARRAFAAAPGPREARRGSAGLPGGRQ